MSSAIVTGGASGIGAALTEAAVLDVADAAAVQEVVQRTAADHGPLAYVFNNAVVPVVGEPEELTLAHWDRALDVNLKGVVHGCHAAYPIMQAQGHGHIVNTSSLAGLIGGPAIAAPYATAKAGIVGLSLTLHAAGAQYGVGVHVVAPGNIETPLLDRSEVDGLATPPSVRGVTMRGMAKDMGATRTWPASELAAHIVRQVDRGKPIIVAPVSAGIVWRLFRAFPGAVVRMSAWGTTRWRRSRTSPAA